VLQYFSSWNEAVLTAGFEPDSTNVRLDNDVLLQDWGELVRRNRRIPTRTQYRHQGRYSPGVFERHFGPWSTIPARFRQFAQGKPEWADVLALLPVALPKTKTEFSGHTTEAGLPGVIPLSGSRHTKLQDRPIYGDPSDFRGLRHEPINEMGVVFLFGMVARELGYLVEAVQAGFPDCEAKRQIDAGKRQRVRIEFESESRNFCDHGHAMDDCDVIVCWRHNWQDCPTRLDIVELSSVIDSLAKSDE
jgi:hypothetical protein